MFTQPTNHLGTMTLLRKTHQLINLLQNHPAKHYAMPFQLLQDLMTSSVKRLGQDFFQKCSRLLIEYLDKFWPWKWTPWSAIGIICCEKFNFSTASPMTTYSGMNHQLNPIWEMYMYAILNSISTSDSYSSNDWIFIISWNWKRVYMWRHFKL